MRSSSNGHGQQSQIVALLKKRDEDLTKGGLAQRRITFALYERRLSALLTENQRLAWAKMTGRQAAQVAAKTVAQSQAAPQPDAKATANPLTPALASSGSIGMAPAYVNDCPMKR